MSYLINEPPNNADLLSTYLHNRSSMTKKERKLILRIMEEVYFTPQIVDMVKRPDVTKMPDDDGWIEWDYSRHDGPNLEGNPRLAGKLRDGTVYDGDNARPADCWSWSGGLGGNTITHYKVVK